MIKDRNQLNTETLDENVKLQSKSVQSLVRGLNILVVVNEKTPATVTQIVASTGLPKATVIRLLKTLSNEGYISMDRTAGGYKPLPKVRLLASPMIADNNFAVAARNYLNDFAQTVKWPTDLLILEGAAMVVQASNRDTAPIYLKRFEQGRFSLLSSASGLAYLSATTITKRQKMINAVASLMKTDDEAKQLVDKAVQEIEIIQQRGYAIADYHSPIDGIRATAIPLVTDNVPFGALAILYLRDAVSEEQLNDFLLPQLRKTALEISRLFSQHGNIMNLAPVVTTNNHVIES
ncbi:helix-turn-helix domain-containing protein [Colwellia sp. RE-S-Sl-9]